MRNFKDTFKTGKSSFIRASSIWMAEPLKRLDISLMRINK